MLWTSVNWACFWGRNQKLAFGHRGANQPVIDLTTNKVCMTSQNHSYVVDEQTITSTPLSVRFKNVNDGSVEGLMHKDLPVISVQYHPEAHPDQVTARISLMNL